MEFALAAEAGPLEAQALLLVESLRRFGGRHAGAAVTVFSHRAARRPSGRTVRALKRLDAEYLALDLASACPEYGPSWRLHALAEVERRPGPGVLVQLDSDTLLLGDVGDLCAESSAMARPVDLKGMATAGWGDPFEPYWSELCELAGVDVEALPFVTSTVDRVRVRSAYNGGFVAARRSKGLFECAEEVFQRGLRAGLRPPHAGSGLEVESGTGRVGPEGSQWWGSTQAALAVAARRLDIELAELDEAINVPLHLWELMPDEPRSVLHAHYHGLLAAGAAQPNPLLDGRIVLPEGAEGWLRERVPLPARVPRRRLRSWLSGAGPPGAATAGSGGR